MYPITYKLCSEVAQNITRPVTFGIHLTPSVFWVPKTSQLQTWWLAVVAGWLAGWCHQKELVALRLNDSLQTKSKKSVNFKSVQDLGL